MFKNIISKLGIFALLPLFVFSSCSKQEADNTVWIYTSMYPEAIAQYEKAFQEKFPDIKVKWFQNGSENINAKLAIEEQAGEVKADLILTADIFWFRKKAEQGFFEPHKPTTDFEIPAPFRDAQDRFAMPRISTVVIGYNKNDVSEQDVPKSFAELADPKWKGKLTSGSPLESGTSLSLMNNLAFRYGYEFLEKLRENDLMSAGGNSAIMQRIVTGERPVGMILLENILATQQINPNIGFVYPSDGVVLITAPIALVKSSKNKVAAKKIYDYFFTKEGQKITVDGFVHGIRPDADFPKGTKPLTEIMTSTFDLSEKFYEFVKKEEGHFKTKYSNIMF